jgi:DUF4097 and DUF4098 domain-containing protein YvlB
MLEHTFQTPQPAQLEVSIPSGDIAVETDGTQETHVSVDGDERLLEHVEVHCNGDRFSFGSFFGDGGLRVEVRAPHGSSVRVKTASADTELEGHFGKLELNSASGDVRLRGELVDDAIIRTVSGDVELERVDGDLSVQCVSGDVRARAIAGSVDTKSVSGDIRLDALASGNVRFTSVSGDIEIGIAPGSLLDVDAGSTSGDLSSEVPLASEPPSGESSAAPTVVLRGRTVSGDVRVFRAG